MYTDTGPKNLTFLVSGDVKPPLSYKKLVSVERKEGFEQNRKKITIWRPVAPDGYVALGDIVDVGADSVYPDLNAIVCVPITTVSVFEDNLKEIFNVDKVIDDNKITLDGKLLTNQIFSNKRGKDLV